MDFNTVSFENIAMMSLSILMATDLIKMIDRNTNQFDHKSWGALGDLVKCVNSES